MKESSTLSRRSVSGYWLAGPNAGRSGVIWDVRAGNLHGNLSDETHVFGSADDFQAQSGETGDRLLELLLPRPRASDFFLGAIRESLAAVYSTANLGYGETQAWERPYSYIVNNGEGDGAVAQLVPDGVVGAITCHDPTRSFQFRHEDVPPDQREVLDSILQLPFLQNPSPPISAVFWTEDGRLCSPEPWFQTYLFGGEIFRRELLDEEAWRIESAEYHSLEPAQVSTILAISRRAIPMRDIPLSAQEIEVLLPRAAKHYQEARELLLGEGFFVIDRKLLN